MGCSSPRSCCGWPPRWAPWSICWTCGHGCAKYRTATGGSSTPAQLTDRSGAFSREFGHRLLGGGLLIHAGRFLLEPARLPVERDPDLGLRVAAADPVRALYALARLQILVDLEEMLDLQLLEDRQITDVLQVRTPRILRRHAQHLVVGTLLVGHPEHAYCSGGHQATGERGLGQQHEGVQRIAVLPEGVLDVPVVGRVLGGGEQRAVQPDPTAVMIHLVLVATALRNLDQDVEIHGGHPFIAAACERRPVPIRLRPVREDSSLGTGRRPAEAAVTSRNPAEQALARGSGPCRSAGRAPWDRERRSWPYRRSASW